MALKGNQKKLDKNNNNRIDAQDFKILKAEKAKGRGQGLQDEKMKPGKPMKAVLGAIALGLGAKKMMDKKKMTATPGIGAAAAIAAKKKEILGKRIGGVMKAKKGRQFFTARVTGDDNSFDKKMKLQKEGIINKKTGAGRERLTKAVKSVKLGKRLLAPVALGVGAVQYLKSKMKKKDEPKKKMGGGMMQKPMGYNTGGGTSGDALDTTKFKKTIKRAKDFRSAIIRDEQKVKKKMGGGMMMKPMGYKAGKSVKAKCKLGRNKPTKMY